MSNFERESASWSADVDAVAADLLARGQASSPAHALRLAEAEVQARRQSAALGDVLAKVLPADSGPIGGVL